MKKFAILFILLLVPTNASALFQEGNLVGYMPYQNTGKKIFLFRIEGNVQGGCNFSSRFGFDVNHLNYDAMVAAIMAAYHANTPIKVSYTETCDAWTNAYDAKYLCTGSIC